MLFEKDGTYYYIGYTWNDEYTAYSGCLGLDVREMDFQYV